MNRNYKESLLINAVNIYIAKISDIKPETLAIIKNKVSDDMRMKTQKFRVYSDVVRSIAGEFIALKMCTRKYDIDIGSIRKVKNEFGKPYFINYSNFQYSISHSGDYVVCAVGDIEVGIDIQENVTIEDGCCKLFMTNSEYQNIKDSTPALLWSYKESYAKLKGQGLSLPFSEFTVRNDKEIYYEKDRHIERCYFYSRVIDSVYYMVLACNEKTDVTIKYLTEAFFQ